ncbi:HAMP domain-containing histidine kinase [Paenibacillus pasadenensis]|uniref:sensor histidine kinase n=1 Tax=Paenibacillus pasadenensis TaxID=217090 RepID=UPI00203C29D4|nr:HAMP domain-containing histidine kinase [Paenibacillus pasadenensis]
MRRHKERTRAKIRGVFAVIGIISWLALCWIGAYYVMQTSGWKPSPLVEHLAGAALGFLIFGLTVGLMARVLNKRNFDLFQSILDALRQIASGDFQVEIKLPEPWDDRNHFNHLVRGINDMAADLGRMEIMRQEFISNVSHEIQSPLTSISGFAQALKDDSLPPDQRKRYLDIIEQESIRLSRLSDNMLRLASLDSEHHPFHPRTFRLDRQLQQAMLSLEPLWSAKNQEIGMDAEPLEVEADDDLLRQVWTNLLHNAVKFTPEGGAISIKLRSRGSDAVVEVENSGAGIPADSLPFIFDRFYKVDPSRTRKGGGSGLGLSISRKIMQMHGGSISAASEEGAVTVMTAVLPLHRPE